MAAHCSALAWRVPWTEEPVTYSLQGRTESDTAVGLREQTRGSLGVILTAPPSAVGATF